MRKMHISLFYVPIIYVENSSYSWKLYTNIVIGICTINNYVHSTNVPDQCIHCLQSPAQFDKRTCHRPRTHQCTRARPPLIQGLLLLFEELKALFHYHILFYYYSIIILLY